MTDPTTGKPLELTRDELETLKKLTRNEQPGDGYDPYPDMVEWFTGKGMEEVMPLSAAPEPKRRFVPSMHEHKRVMKMVKAIKEGRIKPFRAPEEEEREREEAELDYASYDVWANEAPKPDHPMVCTSSHSLLYDAELTLHRTCLRLNCRLRDMRKAIIRLLNTCLTSKNGNNGRTQILKTETATFCLGITLLCDVCLVTMNCYTRG